MLDQLHFDHGLSVSRLTFGTGSLHHLSDRKAARLLALAIEGGITHFDTAPSYGFGLAEKRLGIALRSHPALTVTTKVGLYHRGPSASSWAGVLARKGLSRISPALNRARANASLSVATRSLETSLRRLGRNRIDVLYLHEPDAAFLRSAEWRRWSENERRSGRIGVFGLAGAQDRLLSCLPGTAGFSLQTSAHPGEGVETLVRAGGRPDFLYSPLSRRPPGQDVPSALQTLKHRFPTSSLIISTRGEDRLGALLTWVA